jgi:hypothetical protein
MGSPISVPTTKESYCETHTPNGQAHSGGSAFEVATKQDLEGQRFPEVSCTKRDPQKGPVARSTQLQQPLGSADEGARQPSQ